MKTSLLSPRLIAATLFIATGLTATAQVKSPRVDEARRESILKQFDRDGDGKLSPAERAAARAHMEQRMRTRMEKQLERLKAVDTDGDGKISDAEWAAAREQMQAWRQEHGPKAGKKQD
ncbi:MAG TPA: EF-hand domain-containing protein [Opitutaceae bacterium]|nr:EF-hand domain-containing protein [Opitutaceae bacterium]HRJ47132.1 EF-hand domain-containing protein [Opitutaceae bacterium]